MIDSILPSRSALLRLRPQLILEALRLWRQRSDAPEYQGQRVLSTRDLLALFRPGRNVWRVEHVRDGRAIKVQVGHNLRTTAGLDWEAQILGGGVNTALSFTGTAGTPTATTLPDAGAPGWTVNAWAGHMVAAAGVYGTVLSNTATVLTIDRWNNGTTIQTQAGASTAGAGAAGTTPGVSAAYVILPGAAPALWMALDTGVHTPVVGDTALTTETAASGLARTPGSYAHTGAATTYTLTKTVTNTSAGAVGPINNAALLTAQNAGTLVFYTPLSTPPTLAINDQLSISPWTVNI